jgi:hypothetical protein
MVKSGEKMGPRRRCFSKEETRDEAKEKMWAKEKMFLDVKMGWGEDVSLGMDSG